MSGRLAEALLYLSQEKFKEESIYEYITRRDVADLSGMSIESMNKVLNEFKSKSLIETEGKVIKILDYYTLTKISTYG
jgi:CRP/FNR family transcriptional regulator